MHRSEIAAEQCKDDDDRCGSEPAHREDVLDVVMAPLRISMLCQFLFAMRDKSPIGFSSPMISHAISRSKDRRSRTLSPNLPGIRHAGISSLRCARRLYDSDTVHRVSLVFTSPLHINHRPASFVPSSTLQSKLNSLASHIVMTTERSTPHTKRYNAPKCEVHASLGFLSDE